MNVQPPEKQSSRTDGMLEVHSIFHTIQGEGPYTGQRATFVRLTGCNLQCPLCDTEYTNERSWLTPAALLDEVNKSLPEGIQRGGTGLYGFLVVITGGEPFRQNLYPAIEALVDAGYNVQIETNGTLYQDLPFNQIVVVCSPKTGSIHKRLAQHLTALKYVICAGDVSEEDGLPLSALQHPANPQLARPPEDFHGIIYVQPADEADEQKNKLNLDAAVQSVLKFGHVLQLQTHKIIGLA